MTTATLQSFSSLSPAGSGRIITSVARRELKDALSSRWFLLNTVSFAVLAIAVSFISLAGMGSQGFAGFGRTTAGLLNLIMLVVPLMALTVGAASIAGERERGTLLYLLAQPVSRLEVLLGKFVGLSLALVSSVALGFGGSAAVLAIKAGGGTAGVGSFLMLVAFACLLAVVMLSVGLLISTLSRKTGVATGIALFVWLTMVFLSDLGLMAGALVFKLHVHELFALAVSNPLQAFKMAVVVEMNASLDVLGPAGVYASQTYGSNLSWILPLILVAWGTLSLSAAAVVFSRRAPV